MGISRGRGRHAQATHNVDILVRRETCPPRSRQCRKPASSIATRRPSTCSWTARRPRPATLNTSCCAGEGPPRVSLPSPMLTRAKGDFVSPAFAGIVGADEAYFRDKDRMHLRDLLDVGLIDAAWPRPLPAGVGCALA